jgi:outer membrane receptor protein involved in Fe transport
MIRPAFLVVLATAAATLVSEGAVAAESLRPGMGKVVAQKKKKKKKKAAPADGAAPADAAAAKPAEAAAPATAKAGDEAVAAPTTPAVAAPAAAPAAEAPPAAEAAKPAEGVAAPVAEAPKAEPAAAPVEPSAPAAASSEAPPAAPVVAQGAEGPTDSADLEALLDSNVVSGASRSAEKADDAPATTTTITADDLRRYGIRTLGEALNFLSLGMFSQDPLHAVEVGSRGVLLSADYGNHVLLVVDGNIMNEPWNGTAYFEQGAGIPLEMIDHIEVITGAGSVLYGSYAMLGVINVVTKSAKDSRGVHGVLEGSASPPVNSSGQAVLTPDGAGGTVRIGASAAAPFTLAGKEGEYGIGFEYYGHSGPTFGFAPQVNAGDLDTTTGNCAPGAPNYGPKSFAPCVWGGRAKDAYWTSVPTALAKARWGDFSAFLKATQYGRSQPGRSPLFGITAGDFNSADSFERDRTLVGELKWQSTLTPELSAMARLYGATYQYLQNAYSHDYERDGSGLNVPDPSDPAQGHFYQVQKGVSQWGGLELQGTYDLRGDGKYPLLFGLDNRIRRIGYVDDAVDVPTGKSYGTVVNYDRVEWLVAPYVQQRAKVTNEVQLNAGLRMDAQTDFSPALSPRFAAVFNRPSIGIVKLVVSSAFRTPTGYERFTAIPGEMIANPSLTPERVWTGEVSYERRFGKHRVLAGTFLSHFGNMVAYVPAPNTTAGTNWFDNSNAITNAGVNLLAEGSVDAVRYGATLTVAQASTDSGRDLTVSPNWYGNIHAGYDLPKPLPVLSTAIAYFGSMYGDMAFNAANTSIPSAVWRDNSRSPVQVDWRFIATGEVPQVKGLSYRAMLNFALHDRSPYAVGPQSDVATGAVLSPVNRVLVLGGVQYDLDVL